MKNKMRNLIIHAEEGRATILLGSEFRYSIDISVINVNLLSKTLYSVDTVVKLGGRFG